MGWGEIAGGGAEGLYSLKLDFGKATLDKWIEEIDAWIAKTNVEIAAIEAPIAAAKENADALRAKLQGLVEELAGEADGSKRSAELQALIYAATQEFLRAEAKEDTTRIRLDQWIAERTALVKKKNDLQSTEVERTVQAWCVDYTEGATGYVATIEVPGEDQAVLIAPGGRQPTQADGALMARELMTPWQAFWNAAVLPGWQKWKPTYRKATVTWLDEEGNLANVTLDPATSSAARLPVNQTPQLNGIPVQYMDCHAIAFEVGDRVVVEFVGQNWQSPRVVGFVTNPRPCVEILVEYYVNSETVFSERFYPGQTAPGWSAPAYIPPPSYEPPGSPNRPFAGWDDGVNSLEHPEFTVKLPNRYYFIKAVYAESGLEHQWFMTPHFVRNNWVRSVPRYNVYGELIGYDHYATTTWRFDIFIFVNASQRLYDQIGIQPIYGIEWTSGEGGPWASQFTNDAAVPFSDGPVITDYIPTSYSFNYTNQNGWTIEQEFSAMNVSDYQIYMVSSGLTANPP